MDRRTLCNVQHPIINMLIYHRHLPQVTRLEQVVFQESLRPFRDPLQDRKANQTATHPNNTLHNKIRRCQ